MNRIAIASLAAAAIIGTGGGFAAALTAGDSGDDNRVADQGQTPGQSLSPTSTPTGAATPPASPVVDGGGSAATSPGQGAGDVKALWRQGNTFHDGDTVVTLPLPKDRTLMDVQRFGTTGDQWLVVEQDTESGNNPVVRLVGTDGTGRVVAKVYGDFDVSPDGSRIVGARPGLDGYDVYDVGTGRLIASMTGLAGVGRFADDLTPHRASFEGNDHLLSVVQTGETSGLYRTDLTGKHPVIVDTIGEQPDYVNADATKVTTLSWPSEGETCLTLRSLDPSKTSATRLWKQCGYVDTYEDVWSPAQDKLRVETVDKDGSGPADIAVLDASDGRELDRIGTAELGGRQIADHAWADDDHLLVVSSDSLEEPKDMKLHICEIGGSCTVIASSSATSPILIGA